MFSNFHAFYSRAHFTPYDSPSCRVLRVSERVAPIERLALASTDYRPNSHVSCCPLAFPWQRGHG